MKRKVFSAFIAVIMIFSLFVTALASPGNGNADNSWGDLGNATGGSGWNPGMDGVRVSIVKIDTEEIVGTPIDYTKVDPASNSIHFGYKSKLQYRNGAELGAINGDYIYKPPCGTFPTIISSNNVKADIEAIKEYFGDEVAAKMIAENSDDPSIDFETLTNGEYKLLLEPIAYFKFFGLNYAMTATEAAIFDQKVNGQLRNGIYVNNEWIGGMKSLSHQNLPLALFLEEPDLDFPVYDGAKSGAKTNDVILAFLGMGIITYDLPVPEPEPEEPEALHDFDLDYNILERDITFKLGATTATLTKPKGDWNGNATGVLNVYNNTTSIYRNFLVDESTSTSNPYPININEGSETITRNPTIRTKLRRQDFGDNPLGGGPYYDIATTSVKTGEASAGGSVSRGWKYVYYDYCSNDNCSGHRRTETGTATASFNSITDTKALTAHVYNGKPVISPPTFTNTATDFHFVKTMGWTSTPILLDVVRLMYNQTEDGALYPGEYPSKNDGDGIPVKGRYQRVFTAQNAADINWSVDNSMWQEYKDDSDKAKERDYDLDGDEKAAFASDFRYNHNPAESKEYPVRSGYYFNPAGTYTFTLNSEIYKDAPGSTDEHEKLVNDFIASFQYVSEMVYIDALGNPVRIDGSPASKPLGGTTYPAQAAFVGVGNSLFDISNASHTETVNTTLFDIDVQMDYELVDEEELEHNYIETGANAKTDSRFKKILEGYSQSGTQNSSTDYKYVEFVKDGEHVYLITESTTVTFTLNPDNKKVYTHEQMKNGDYIIRLYADVVDMRTVTEYGTPAQPGVHSPRGFTSVGDTLLDEINVSVVGSMYDDAR